MFSVVAFKTLTFHKVV